MRKKKDPPTRLERAGELLILTQRRVARAGAKLEAAQLEANEAAAAEARARAEFAAAEADQDQRPLFPIADQESPS